MPETFLFTLEARGSTHVGRVRAVNQDSFLCDLERKLFVIADGMGGHAGGEIASSLAVINVRNYLDKNIARQPLPLDATINAKFLSIVSASISYACEKIYERSLEEPVLKGMGTTLSVMKIEGAVAYFGHVGDSRVYVLRQGYLYQLSTDHSLVGEQVRAGLITKEEAERHHLRNVVTRSVGYQENEDVDVYTLVIEDGDLFLLCSDGLHGKISEVLISELCSNHGIYAVEHLINAANSAGGEDNISAIVVQVKSS
jgi:serine/threonine protein phosphatase PrpC